MGKINTIWDPKYWEVCLEGKSKITEDDIVYKMIIGEGIDYQDYNIFEFISKCNYDNLLTGKYYARPFPYEEVPILLFNEYQELIPLVKGREIPYEKLSEIQKDYIDDMHREKLLIKKYMKK